MMINLTSFNYKKERKQKHWALIHRIVAHIQQIWIILYLVRMINGLCNIVDDVSKKAEKYVFTKAKEQSFNLFFLAMAKHTEFL